MPTALFTTRVERGLVLDPRTKIYVLLVVCTVVMTSNNSLCETFARTITISLPFLFVLVSGRPFAAITLLSLYGASSVLIYATPYVPPALSTFITVNCMILGRFLPTIATGYFIMTTTTVSEFMAAMRRIHIPDAITIPLSVLFRFFPTLLEEIQSINSAMKMRNITLRTSGPLALIEYRLIPLMACALSIGEDLSASALTRGLDSPNRRTDICEIGFHVQDIIIIVSSSIALLIMALGWIGVALP